jgi:hypothetical protein
MQHVSVRPIPNYRTSALGGRLVGDCASGRSGVLNDKKTERKRRRRQRYNSKAGQQALGEHGAISLVRWRAGKLGHSQFQIRTDG